MERDAATYDGRPLPPMSISPVEPRSSVFSCFGPCVLFAFPFFADAALLQSNFETFDLPDAVFEELNKWGRANRVRSNTPNEYTPAK